VTFDPDRIRIQDMEKALRKAGTYVETLPPAAAEQKTQ
jgi:hypothetical protein